VGSCLGDLYSVNWMQDSETAGFKQTLEDQFRVVQKQTDKSHVMQYGDTSWTAEPIGDFEVCVSCLFEAGQRARVCVCVCVCPNAH
jgi:hypothetical protein